MAANPNTHSSRYSPVKQPEESTQTTCSPIGSQTRSPSPRPLTHRDLYNTQLWRKTSWRFACAVIFSTLIAVILRSFEKMGQLDAWERRCFNTLAILLSSLMSLSLGSLIGTLGGLIRWPLLARKLHTPRDVDMILGMVNPTASLKLITGRIKDRQWMLTTFVATLYLLVNIVSRLSIAAFGLTFDLNEVTGIEYPVKVTDWSTDEWFRVNVHKNTLVGDFSDYESAYPIFYELNTDSPDFLHILRGIYGHYGVYTFDFLWAARLAWGKFLGPSAYATTSENSSYAAALLLRFGAFERVYGFDPPADSLAVRLYSSMGTTSHFVNNLTTANDSNGTVTVESELQAAHLAARLPILSVIGADRQLPKVTKEQGASERPFVSTAVQVRWDRAFGVLGGILIGHYLSVARLLRTAVHGADLRSVDFGVELAAKIGTKIKYGTKQNQEGYYEVDLWEDVENVFPKGDDHKYL
ncbi:hypothetical protein DL767_007023 [Monosporascus sp. MG133]|nr:hypothetical protein DL767_007023 [Monosporascus sp. MG133]